MAQPGGLGLAMPGVPAGAGGAPGPPGGGGGTLPGGTAVPPPPPPPRDYRSRFGNPELDSYGGDYAGLQAVFAAQAPAGTQPPQPAGLLRRAQAYSSRPASQAYVALIDRGGGVRVETFLNPSPHADLPGLPPSGYDGQTIAQLGDVRRSRDGYVSLSAVTLVATNFRLANQGAPCTVPTVDTVDALLAAAGDPAVGLGPFAVGAADTQQVRTRHMIPIGASLASLCVHQRPTPPEFWRTVCAHIRADPGRAVACTAVLDWARVALLAPVAPATERLNESAPTHLVDLTEDMLEGRLDLVKRDLPGLRPGSDDPLTMVASSVSALVGISSQSARDAALRRAQDDAPKPASSLLKGALEAVLRLCEVDHEAALPPVYQSVANADKGDRLPVAQRDLNRLVASDPTYSGAAPSLTAEMLRRLLEPRWGGVDVEDINDSLTPFQTSFSSTKNQAARVRLQDRYTLLASGQVITLAEIIQLEVLEKLNVATPVTWTQLKFTLIGYYFLCVQWLGVHHRVARGVSASIRAAQAQELFLTEVIERRPQLPVLILRRWQQRLFHFFNAHAAQPNYQDFPFPNLTTMWSEILEGSWMEPPLPVALVPLVPSGSVAVPGILPTDVSSLGSYASLMTQSTASTSTTASGFPPPRGGGGPPPGGGGGGGPPPGGPTPPGGPAPGRGAGELRMKVGGPVPRVVEIAGSGWKSKEVKERFASSWPKNKKGHLMCLPWHYRGSCYTLCGRRGDHIDHDPEEEETLCVFLTDNFGEFRSN